MARGLVDLINTFPGRCQAGKCTQRGDGLEVPVELCPELVFKFPQAVVAIKNHPGVSVVLDGQIAPEGAKFSAFDTIKIRFGSKGGGDDLLPDVSGINDRVDDLPLIGLHTVHPRLCLPGIQVSSASSSSSSSMIFPMTS
jgi:hypothetical protein